MPDESQYSACREDFKYEWAHEYKLPILVLAAIAHPHWEDRSKMLRLDFKRGRKFLPIAHQTAGHGCNQHHLWGTILTPRQKVAPKIEALADKWLDSDVGFLDKPLDAALDYRADLRGMGVDCNHTWQRFEEAYYPIDLTDENLRKLATDKLPLVKDLDKLVRWPKPVEKRNVWEALTQRAHWELCVLGPNCD